MTHALKKNAISFASNVVIGVASTAPAYSMAATLGFIVAVTGVGVHAPAVMLVAFVPMLLVAAAYKYLNRADPDAGTSFAWTTRALGPGVGWLNGWAIFLADLIVMASLSDIAAVYTFKLFGFSELSESKPAIIIAAVIWIALMTWICFRGIELSARIQQILLGAEVGHGREDLARGGILDRDVLGAVRDFDVIDSRLHSETQDPAAAPVFQALAARRAVASAELAVALTSGRYVNFLQRVTELTTDDDLTIDSPGPCREVLLVLRGMP